jgi:hypothetical protein
MIKSFSGILADGGQDRIYLAGGDSTKGYKIVKFQPLGVDSNTAYEGTVQIFKVEQAAIPQTIDMSSDDLLAAAILQQSTSTQGGFSDAVVFDTEVVNQDIFIVHDERSAGVGAAINYYIELEEVTMSSGESAVVNFNAALIHT